jgi:hypothetical protein
VFFCNKTPTDLPNGYNVSTAAPQLLRSLRLPRYFHEPLSLQLQLQPAASPLASQQPAARDARCQIIGDRRLEIGEQRIREQLFSLVLCSPLSWCWCVVGGATTRGAWCRRRDARSTKMHCESTEL